MRFYGFHLMPWPYLDEAHRNSGAASWVTLSNKEYDPVRGRELYERYLSELVAYDQAGFDGVCVNEHHQTAYGLMPAPNLVAATLIGRTRGTIALLGNAIALRDHPLRVAEEVAMLDVLSNGRIVSGFVRGIGSEYHTFALDPASSRDRFHEAHDLIVRAWTEPGPFEWYGEHYKLRYVNPWPRPIQQPNPPIWSPSQGSGETIEWAAERRYTYLQTFTDLESLRRIFASFKEATERHGYAADPEQLGWSVPIYLAESDEAARAGARPHVDYLFNTLLRMPPDMLFPAGYLTEASAARVRSSRRGLGSGRLDPDDLMERGYVLAGSPASVGEALARLRDELGFGTLVGVLQFGSVSHGEFERTLSLFTEQVMQHLR